MIELQKSSEGRAMQEAIEVGYQVFVSDGGEEL